MKNLSYWALLNPIKSIFLIVVCQTVLAALGSYVGVWLISKDVIVPRAVIPVGLTLLFLALIFYPIRRARNKIWKYNFVKQKSMDAILVCSFMMITIAISNSDAKAALQSDSENPFVVPIVLKNEFSVETSTLKVEGKWSRSQIRRELKNRFKKIRLRNEIERW